MNKKHYLKKSIIFIIICIVLISLDQITKYAAVNSLTDNTKVLIKNYNYIMYNHRIYIYKAAL